MADEPSVFAWASALLRWRRLVIVLGIIGGALGLSVGLLSKRVYATSATFIPQGSEGTPTALAMAASQFGISIPSSGGGWGPPIYVELLRSHALLAPIALDTFVVNELNGRRVALADLLRVDEPTGQLRAEHGVRALRAIISVREVTPLGAVRVTVTTRWPSVSLAITERLVQAVNDFNLNTRKSQAAAEREFVEVRAQEAEDRLRQAESRLLTFLERNRTIVAPELMFERDRLQRNVTLQTQAYTTLLQAREDARIREVRDIPVITLLEAPRQAVLPQPRKSVQKALLGGIAAAALGILIAFLAEAMAAARRRPNEQSQEFFRLVAEATPRFLKKRRIP